MTIQTEQQQIAQTILEQIPTGVLWSLGATNFHSLDEDKTRRGGLTFKARVLPMRKDGTRATRARVMRVDVELTFADDYRIQVYHFGRRAIDPIVVHFEQGRVYADRLQRVMLALDYDGDEVLNPRYV